MDPLQGLNPFQSRARWGPNAILVFKAQRDVLIPFKAGLVGDYQLGAGAWIIPVLIPFKAGLVGDGKDSL